MTLKQTIDNVDTDQLRADAAALAETVAVQAERAADIVSKAYGDARTRVVDDYLPRAQRAAAAAYEAAAAPAPKPKKRCRKGFKALGWLAVAGAAAGAAYVVWRRSQPVEDPWAEEYWADSEDSEA